MEPDARTVEILTLERLDPEVSRNPQPFYKKVRDQAPVIRTEGSVSLARHEEIEHALRHPEVYSSAMGAIGLGNVRPLIPLQIDPPDHKKYRKLLDPLFAPRQMANLEGDVVKLTNELIDAFVGRGECELNGELAVPLPCTVFLRLLGLPQEDLGLFLRFKDDIIRPGGGALDPFDTEASDRIRRETGQEMYAYFERMLDQREHDPRDDLLTRFLHSEVDGEQLTREEILDILFLFLIAGLDTVTDTLDCSFAFLAQHPDHRRQIAEDPSIIPSAVEELLRWETPVPGVVRIATRDTTIGGCPVHQGDIVSVMIGSANTDETFWERAHEVDFRRDPNPHLAFGGGVHRCLGSHLARLELRVAMREWHRRIPEYRLPDGVELEYTPALRQVEHLPLVFDRVVA
ncbi:MAG: cytochrome P450 [Acidimicrobiia bacterium]|nr:cytochrome P450 [Acidimicrobiia bacterium]